ncbi:hypothetical protein FNV43_RR15213 [Rhamnella rubrinervis]|uniref:Uncharacterized protein n=1 Tax=Rhamnella rubrinervis TaxID=2594499 RepID=A0A8K0E8K2_9ROSA|nr:hypothetical protein FNV43_RR15213 [Rhamnella rubrinervis]
MSKGTQRYAVVTDSYNEIGFETVKLLASKGTNVVLTARDEKKGLESVEKLKQLGLPGQVLFHKLDLTDPASIASLADFIKTQFGKLDILVNKETIPGVVLNQDAFVKAFEQSGNTWPAEKYWNEIQGEQSYELAEECLKTNYYGAKGMIEQLLPLLQLSDSPTIANVSAPLGMLRNLPIESAKEILGDVENLTVEKVDEVLTEFMKEYKQGKRWPSATYYMTAYRFSKAALNAYTRMLAKKYPNVCVNCVSLGYVKSDLTCYTGFLTAEEGAQNLLNLADEKTSGVFLSPKGLLSF